jgi:7-carboxy-7-deazaguanine synthase
VKIVERFLSIEGEGTHAGLPCWFIRASGCNLRCGYCDTAYAYEGGEELGVDVLVAEAMSLPFRRVHLTGGEPLLQPDAPDLVMRLLGEGFTVLVETNGSLDISILPEGAVVVMDVKTPGSGMNGRMRMDNLGRLKPTDEVKFVLTSRGDYEWARGVIREHGLVGRCHVLLSPAYGMLDPAGLSAWMLHDGIDARLNMQLHKIIHGPDKQGV